MVSGIGALSVLTLLLGLLFPPQRIERDPRGYMSRGRFYIAEVFPPFMAVNSSSKPLCYLYQYNWVSHTSELVWKHELVNRDRPGAAILSHVGDFVTLGDYSSREGVHAVVLYSRQGDLVRSFSNRDLIDEAKNYDYSKRKFYFTTLIPHVPVTHLYMVLPEVGHMPTDRVVEFRLQDGAYKLGAQGDFPVLDSLRAVELTMGEVNESTGIYEFPLMFSSITELQDCRSDTSGK